MKQNKPACSDFIIATIREMRRKPQKNMPGVNSGVGFDRVLSIVRQLYSGKEYKESLVKLMREGSVVAVVGSSVQGVGYRKLEIDQLPSNPVFEKKQCQSFQAPMLYVRADGLPKKISHLVRPSLTLRARAEKILASLKRH